MKKQKVGIIAKNILNKKRTGNTCMEYIPKFNSLYVLEVNPTLVKRFNIRVGDNIFFN